MGTRIAAGFGVVLLLHLAVAIVGHLGISGGREDLEAIDAERQWTEGMVEIDRVVREVQQAILLYAFTGHQSLESRVETLNRDLAARLEAATAIAGELPDLVEMQRVLARYEEQFQLAREDRAKRREIVDHLLVDQGDETAQSLDRLASNATAEADAWREQAREAQREFLHARAEALEYVHRLDYASMRSAMDRIRSCGDLIAGINSTEATSVTLLSSAQGLVNDYRQLLNQLVQRTRGYLHLVNVVIAGETAEFLRLSARVRERHVDQLNQAYVNGIAAQERFEQISLWVSVITVFAGLIAGVLITRSVVDPIQSLADTFDQLGAGRKDVVVPSRDRRDEIGEMAQAAEVFRKKNADTAQLLEDSRRSNRDLEQFAAVASHDLQEPLRMVASYVQLLEQRYSDDLDDNARQFIGYAVDGTVRMKTLINDLLAYSRVGRATGSPEDARLSDVLADVRSDLEVEIEEKGVRITFEGEDVPVYVDRSQLKQVVQNLLSNAIKFGAETAPAVTVGCRAEDDRWLAWVTDNGIGMKAEHLERIFEVFQRLHRRDQYEGSGIGLAVCRRLVERRGGRIWAESEVGVGTTVYFTIPNAGMLQE